jgi:hypothetical protein
MFLMISQSRTAYASAGSKLETVSVVQMMIVSAGVDAGASVAGASVAAGASVTAGASVAGACVAAGGSVGVAAVPHAARITLVKTNKLLQKEPLSRLHFFSPSIYFIENMDIKHLYTDLRFLDCASFFSD